MHGLIFVTWEKYIQERFGTNLLNDYRATIGETVATAPLASRVYEDEVLLAGVGAAHTLTGIAVDTLLREYGRYFIENGLTSHLCAYLLAQVHSGRELLLTMRRAHAQMRRTPDSLTPPLFSYETFSPNPDEFVLIYDSPRKLCSVLLGAIEGAASRYHEQVQIHERTCMKQGADVCRFEIRFFTPSGNLKLAQETPEQRARREQQQHVAQLVLSVLPAQDGFTLANVQTALQYRQVEARLLRPSIVLEALRHLQHAGLASSTANQAGDDLTSRRYWRTPT